MRSCSPSLGGEPIFVRMAAAASPPRRRRARGRRARRRCPSGRRSAGRSRQIQWLHSYVTDDRIYCVYLSPDEATIREHARKLGVPANRVSAVRRLIDPKKYA
jgi:hypothetical protein